MLKARGEAAEDLAAPEPELEGEVLEAADPLADPELVDDADELDAALVVGAGAVPGALTENGWLVA